MPSFTLILQNVSSHSLNLVDPTSQLTFPATSEEVLHNKDLQRRHCNHQSTLNQIEVEYPPLCALDRTEVSVLSRTEVLLLPCQGRYLA